MNRLLRPRYTFVSRWLHAAQKFVAGAEGAWAEGAWHLGPWHLGPQIPIKANLWSFHMLQGRGGDHL